MTKLEEAHELVLRSEPMSLTRTQRGRKTIYSNGLLRVEVSLFHSGSASVQLYPLQNLENKRLGSGPSPQVLSEAAIRKRGSYSFSKWEDIVLKATADWEATSKKN